MQQIPHDAQGFLVGEIIPDIRRQTELMTRIRADVADIKRAFQKLSQNSNSDASNPPTSQAGNSSRRSSGPQSDTSPGSNTAEPNPRGGRTRRAGNAGNDGSGDQTPPILPDVNVNVGDSPNLGAGPDPAPVNGPQSDTSPGSNAAEPNPRGGRDRRDRNRAADQPPASPNGRGRHRDSRGRFISENEGDNSTDQHNRDRRGRFTSNNEGDTQAQRTLLNGLADRIADAVTLDTGLEEVDPTVKAFQEIAEPVSRGFQFIAGDNNEDNRWFRRLFNELRLFRRDESVFNRAANRSLDNIEEAQSADHDNGGPSFLGGLLGSVTPFIMAALTSIGGMMVTGATALLGTIFGPIGLMIGGLATAAWGLFTEDGRKFFADVADKLYLGWNATTDYLKGKWDEGVKAFSDLWEPIAKFFEDKFGIVSGAVKTVAKTVENTADKANDFVKEKTGVDVKESVKSVNGEVKTAYEKTVDTASRNVIEPTADFFKSSAQSVKAVPKKLKERWQEAKQFLGEAAVKAGVDPGILAKIANFESGFNAEARPVRKRDGKVLSSAHGYGQFLDATWTEMVNKYGTKYGVENAGNLSKSEAGKLRSDKALQASLLAEFTRENIEKGRALGGANDDANVYALHNLGEGDGAKFLKALKQNPNAKVSDILSQKVIAGNQSLYGNGTISLEKAYQNMESAMHRGETFAKEIRIPSLATVAPAQTISAPSPSVPAMPKPQAIADMPAVMTLLVSDGMRKSISINIDKGDIGQDISDRRLAHIVTGGLSG
jgi:hypothetical protein